MSDVLFLFGTVATPVKFSVAAQHIYNENDDLYLRLLEPFETMDFQFDFFSLQIFSQTFWQLK